MGVTIQDNDQHSFVSHNAREAITENWYVQLDKLDSIQEREWLETTHKKY